jgi:K+/H+ antiporter YhaU regulatory subunit KhtT
MNLFQSALRTLSISLDGAKEAIMAVAERVARRVQVTKLQLQAEDAEARLKQAYQALGQCLYDTHAGHPPGAFTVDDALPLCESIRAEQRALQELRDRLASRYDDVLILPLIRLQEDLQEGGGTIERVTIAPNAPADGKPLGEVPLPDSVRVALVRRNESLLYPSAQLVLRAGDQLTVIGNRSALPGALQLLRA